MQPDAEQPELPSLDGMVETAPESLDLPDAGGEEPGLSSAEAAADPVDGEQPPTDPEAGEDSDKPRRRGRRGGRRRRSDEDEQPVAPPALAAPAPYAGPTPANPYASGIDIFDVMELAEEREAQLALRSTQAPVTEAARPDSAEPEPFETLIGQEITGQETTGQETTGTPDAVEPEAATPADMPAEPVLDLELPTPEPSSTTATPDAAAAETEEQPALPELHQVASAVPAPPVEPVAEKRRGWWSR